VNASAAEVPIQLTLLLHDHIGQRAVKNRNGHAQHQSGDFHDHGELSLCMAPDSRNQYKNLVKRANVVSKGQLRVLELGLALAP
jgi:hypothetical protein